MCRNSRPYPAWFSTLQLDRSPQVLGCLSFLIPQLRYWMVLDPCVRNRAYGYASNLAKYFLQFWSNPRRTGACCGIASSKIRGCRRWQIPFPLFRSCCIHGAKNQ
jgi:hypothetical protein